MRSVEARFNKALKRQPNASSLIAFAMAVHGQNFGSQTLHRQFNRLVEKDDYDSAIKRAVVAGLEKLNGTPGQQETGVNSKPATVFAFKWVAEPSMELLPVTA